MTRRPLCIYHHPCPDGMTAAWVVNEAILGGVDLHPANYGDEPPDVTGREVYVVDFSYSREQLLEMHEKAEKLVVLDHHKSAQEDLKGLDFAIFDMNESGASLAWRYFNGDDQVIPRLVDYVRDRDLWLKKLAFTEEIHKVIQLTDMDLESWRGLKRDLEVRFIGCIERGRAILDYAEMLTRNAVGRAEWAVLHGEDSMVPLTDCAAELRSEVGHALLEAYPEAPYSATVRDTPDGIVYSLRSEDDREDVSQVARLMRERGALTGGGHRNASGFMAAQRMHVWVR